MDLITRVLRPAHYQKNEPEMLTQLKVQHVVQERPV